MGDIDRIQQLTQSTKLINAFQKVNPADQRQHQKKDQSQREDRSDVVELSQEDPSEESEDLATLSVEPGDLEDSEGDEHLDIAV
jgi:hypothetical protein